MTCIDGPPDSFYEPPDEGPECPECDAPLVEETPGDWMCWCCEWASPEPDYEAISEAKAERRDSGDMI